MGFWPTRGNEDQRRPRESGDPLWVGRKLHSRFRGNDESGRDFQKSCRRRGISHCVEDTQSEVPRGVYPGEHPERGPSLRSG